MQRASETEVEHEVDIYIFSIPIFCTYTISYDLYKYSTSYQMDTGGCFLRGKATVA
jgi:hypothetical protein